MASRRGGSCWKVPAYSRLICHGVYVMARLRTAALIAIALFVLLSISLPVALTQPQDASAVISSTQANLMSCYDATRAAEAAGANITQLTAILNQAGNLIASAQLAYSENDSASAMNLAGQSQQLLNGFVSTANSLENSARTQTFDSFLVNFVGSTAVVVAVIAASVCLWVFLKRRYSTDAVKRTNLQHYKVVFFVVTVVVCMLVASPALQQILANPQTDYFTQLYLQGPGHAAAGYPYNVTSNENYTVYLDIGNHLGSCAYYQVELKFRNATESAPDSLNGTPSSLTPLYSIPAIVPNDATWELPITFSLDYSLRSVEQTVYYNQTFSGPGGNVTVVVPQNVTFSWTVFSSLRVNGANLSLGGLTSDFDNKTSEFYGNLIFELWIYNSSLGSFQYYNRFVDLELNATTSAFA